MDCQTAEGMVSRYIKHDLPLNELEEFLDHVQNCSSCYDELETYFIVHEVTHQLDDDSSDSVLDFKKLLEQDIRKSRRYIRKKKVSWLMFGVSTRIADKFISKSHRYGQRENFNAHP